MPQCADDGGPYVRPAQLSTEYQRAIRVQSLLPCGLSKAPLPLPCYAGTSSV